LTAYRQQDHATLIPCQVDHILTQKQIQELRSEHPSIEAPYLCSNITVCTAAEFFDWDKGLGWWLLSPSLEEFTARL
jgi:hypothetical protein